MRIRNIIAVLLVLLSLVLLVPGLTWPLITISASIEVFGVPQELFKETRSIIQTVRSLHESGNDFVAGLIFLFGVVVPIAKALALGVIALLRSLQWRRRIYVFVRDISKWAMNDVFVVAVYVAFLSAKATDALDARLEIGFYYFASYCLVSLLALQFMKVSERLSASTAPAPKARSDARRS